MTPPVHLGHRRLGVAAAVALAIAAVLLWGWRVNRPHEPAGPVPWSQETQLAGQYDCRQGSEWDLAVAAEGALVRSYTEPKVAHVPLAAAGQCAKGWWIDQLCAS